LICIKKLNLIYIFYQIIALISYLIFAPNLNNSSSLGIASPSSKIIRKFIRNFLRQIRPRQFQLLAIKKVFQFLAFHEISQGIISKHFYEEFYLLTTHNNPFFLWSKELYKHQFNEFLGKGKRI
jgi:hypothetical protein